MRKKERRGQEGQIKRWSWKVRERKEKREKGKEGMRREMRKKRKEKKKKILIHF